MLTTYTKNTLMMTYTSEISLLEYIMIHWNNCCEWQWTLKTQQGEQTWLIWMNGEPSHLYKGHHKNLGPPNHSQDHSQNKNYTGPELQWFCSNSEYTVPYFMSYTYMYEQNSTILQLEGRIEGQEALYCCMYIS